MFFPYTPPVVCFQASLFLSGACKHGFWSWTNSGYPLQYKEEQPSFITLLVVFLVLAFALSLTACFHSTEMTATPGPLKCREFVSLVGSQLCPWGQAGPGFCSGHLPGLPEIFKHHAELRREQWP